MIPIDLMVPTAVATLPVGDAWVHEPKGDGYRAAVMRVGEVQIVSRRGTDLTEVFPDLAVALGEAGPTEHSLTPRSWSTATAGSASTPYSNA